MKSFLKKIPYTVFAALLCHSVLAENSEINPAGVVRWTNLERAHNGNLPALKQNPQLDQAANAKLQDMFKQQYLDHYNPQGVGPAALDKNAGYSYLVVGENLAAMQDSSGYAILFASWMNSPSHRANILNANFQDLGVAVGRGMFKGMPTVLVVQEFATSTSICPSVDTDLKTKIDTLHAEIMGLQTELTTLKTKIDATQKPQTQAEVDAYKQEIAEYNKQVVSFNEKVKTLESMNEAYNKQVVIFDNCLAKLNKKK